VRIASLGEFGTQRKLVRNVGGLSVLLYKSADRVYALNNQCSHLEMPLERGRIVAGQITCPYHGACFDMRTGEAVGGPAVFPVMVFPVRVDGDQVMIDMGRELRTNPLMPRHGRSH
jgi:3-phenylpropionate/trans-cinnamate dioxygenase ferredoxin subunit